jgi:hypothetical protein
MSLAMLNRIKALEVKVTALEGKISEQAKYAEVVRQIIDSQTLASKPLRKMCPKCGVMPAYFFHVKNCNADKNKNNGETDGNGAPGST